MPSTKLKFPGSQAYELAAVLDAPDNEPAAFGLFAHCFTCSKSLKAAIHVCRAMADRGIAVMRFDFTGLGESGGDFADTNFSSNVEDVVAAAAFLEKYHQAPRILIGHSLGGAAMISAAHQIPSCRAVVVIGAPADTSHIEEILDEQRRVAEEHGQATLKLGGKTLRLKKQFFEDLRDKRLTERIAALGRPLIVFHSPQDATVPIEEGERIFDAANHPKSFVSLDGIEHLLTNEDDSRYVGHLIAEWSSRYI